MSDFYSGGWSVFVAVGLGGVDDRLLVLLGVAARRKVMVGAKVRRARTTTPPATSGTRT
jgi:hypothetical protein